MKHVNLIPLCILTVAILTGSCSNDELVEKSPSQTIDFKAMSNKPVSRAEVTSQSIEKFYIFGCVTDANATTNHTKIFHDQLVEKTESSWDYSPKQYWAPNKDYYFVAITTNATDKEWTFELPEVHAPDASHFKGYGTVRFDNSLPETSGTRDLVYAYNALSTGADTQKMQSVDFTFDHMFSRIRIKLTNVIALSGYSIKISNLKVKNTIGKGFVELGGKPSELSWQPEGTGTTDISAEIAEDTVRLNGHLTSESRFIIPGSQALTVTFDIQVFLNDVPYSSHSLTGTIPTKTYSPGHSYMFSTQIDISNVYPEGARPIEFNVIGVHEWNDKEEEEGFELGEN